MKKSTVLMVFAAAASLVSCGGPSTPKANLKSNIDSLSYSLGVAKTQGLMEYAQSRLGVDSVNLNDFVAGIVEGTANANAREKAKLAGMQIGQQLSGDMYEGINKQLFANDSINSLNKEKFINGFIQGVKGESSITTADAFAYIRTKTGAIQKDSVKTALPSNVIDSLSYMMGVSNSQGLISFATTNMGVDSTYITEFTNAVQKGTSITDVKQKAHLVGNQIGIQVSEDIYTSISTQIFGGNTSISLSKENFLAGFIEAIQNKNVIKIEDALTYIRTKSDEVEAKAVLAKYGKYKKENEEFLAKNKTKEGVKTTESGLQYRIITEGKGDTPNEKSRVKVNYKGTLIDGTQFDSSYERNEPTSFFCNQVISGWTEALTMMPVGSKWELYIPQNLAYGSREMGQIKPFSTLIFEVELLSIE